MFKVFIDGKAGTTGLRIYERLASREDIELITLNDLERKDVGKRKQALNAADIAFLCLPDAAAREAVSLVDNDELIIIDTSTAHRTLDNWTYGFPELKFDVKSAKRVSVPGCHASGFLALVKPLIDLGLLKKDARLTCHSLTGYSGGGRKMIEEYQADNRCALLDSPRQYGLTQQHKHLPEMTARSGLAVPPMFSPIVADYYSGMETSVPVFAQDLNGTMDDIKAAYREWYAGNIVYYADEPDADGMLAANALSGKDNMAISVFGNAERLMLVARFDNLGKGASGAAIQCMNILMGVSETTGLEL